MTSLLLLLLLTAAVVQPLQGSMLPAPTPACFALLADAEGEMALAEDPAWRTKALKDLRQRHAEHRLRQDRIAAALADHARQRDRLQGDLDGGGISEDDFNSARSEIQSEVRRLIAERHAEQLPGCGF